MAPLVEELKKQDVVDQLTWDDSVNANDIYVNVDDRSVQLKGKVPNYASKIAATNAAFRVAGVRNVENYLDIEFPPSITLPTDDEITSNINNMLIWNSKILSSDIKVETINGVVTLTGSVSTYWEKYLAEDIANSARGVLEVNNLLNVELTKSIIDIDIENDIKEAYRRSILIDETKIEVSVTNGVVTLTGSVESYPIKREALDIAIYTTGVVEVNDQLYIE